MRSLLATSGIHAVSTLNFLGLPWEAVDGHDSVDGALPLGIREYITNNHSSSNQYQPHPSQKADVCYQEGVQTTVGARRLANASFEPTSSPRTYCYCYIGTFGNRKTLCERSRTVCKPTCIYSVNLGSHSIWVSLSGETTHNVLTT